MVYGLAYAAIWNDQNVIYEVKELTPSTSRKSLEMLMVTFERK